MSEMHRSQVATVLLGLMLPAIWLLNMAWWRMSPDVVIIIGLVPLAWYVALKTPGPTENPSPNRVWVYASVATLSLGILFNQMLMMACGWAGLAVLFCFPPSAIPKLRLWILCAGAFPWVLLELTPLSWWFRLSGASVTGRLFDLLGMDVMVSGTLLEIDGLPISIEAACGGMQLLQVLLSGGVALTLLRFPQRGLFWSMLLLLPVLAWVANTTRIIIISGWGLAFGAERAAGAFHTWGALLVLGLLLGLYHGLALVLQSLFKVEEDDEYAQ
ncbi:archaeosortase/exosortase family protein [Coraliomargarita algicola]|uniref:Archaeosortase/exosortase family protein n=1 Tax=Coraliomargarita algicola TaxID=3092156 RepID=A0ABZ0RPC0_9BACT|nr:archaeosortase/exosortase family protein [Coraliomargarita sp. J2-16]WPJ96820.1 archaeosortase/exosortase family protein [Coraliomargarita sp. J2-16]